MPITVLVYILSKIRHFCLEKIQEKLLKQYSQEFRKNPRKLIAFFSL
jgi:hypothetical protein